MKTGTHFTASVFIVFGNKVLLHRHKRMGFLLPVGGYLEDGETPEQAVIREAKEEAGLEIKVYDKTPQKIVTPFLREINQGERLTYIIPKPGVVQIDFTFYGIATSDQLQTEIDSKNFDWYTKDMLEHEELQEDVRTYALEALSLLGKE